MYGRIFESIFDSSIMEEGVHVRYLWHCILVLSNKEGVVDLTRQALARRVNLPLTQVNEALEALLAPDPSSRSPLEEGRRLVPIREADWGWRIVNFEGYRDVRNPEDRRTYMRQYMRARREKESSGKPEKLTRKQRSTALAPAAASTDTSTPTEERSSCPTATPSDAIARPVNGHAKVYPADFLAFYGPYPRHEAKDDALKAWKATAKARPPIEEIVAAIEAQKKSDNWRKEGGKFIPLPATWLRAGRWADSLAIEGVQLLPTGHTGSRLGAFGVTAGVMLAERREMGRNPEMDKELEEDRLRLLAIRERADRAREERDRATA